MISCNICSLDVEVTHTDKRVFGLIPVEVSKYSYSKAEWFSEHLDNDITSGLSMFIHGKCLDTLVENNRLYRESESLKKGSYNKDDNVSS